MFTIIGGLSTVMWTDFTQTIFILIGTTYLSILSFNKVGGYSALIEKYANSTPSEYAIGYDYKNDSCSGVNQYAMHLIRPPNDKDLPGTGMLLGLTISAIWGWCSDQFLVQRSLSARNLSHVKAACILASYLKILPLFLMIFPGMAARVLYTDKIACSNPEVCMKECGNKFGCSNIAYPMLVLNLMPSGAVGFMIAVMVAALITSLTSIFNSTSTMFSVDVWKKIRKNAGEKEMVSLFSLPIN